VSDGVDQAFVGGPRLSRDNLPQAIGMARTHNVEVYAIGLGPRVDHHILGELCHATGGEYYPARSRRSSSSSRAARSLDARDLQDLVHFSQAGRGRPAARGARVGEGCGHRGTEFFGYRLCDRAPTSTVTVRREHVHAADTGELKIVTLGCGTSRCRSPLSLRLEERDGASLRHQRGWIRRLDSRTLSWSASNGEVPARAGGAGHDVPLRPPRDRDQGRRIRQHVFRFSKLAVPPQRDGVVRHAASLGDTSDLIRLKIASPDSKKKLYEGRLIDFRKAGRPSSGRAGEVCDRARQLLG